MVDTGPRSSSADQSLFGGKMLPRVKTISCGGTSRIRTQHASKNSTSPVVIATLRFYRLFAYSTAETRQSVCGLFIAVIYIRKSSWKATWISFSLVHAVPSVQAAGWSPSGPLGPVNALMCFRQITSFWEQFQKKIEKVLHLATRKVEEALWDWW